jgi:hypothetical protein
MANPDTPSSPALPDVSTIRRILQTLGEIYVPHHMMSRQNYDLVISAFALFTIGSFVISLGRSFLAAGPQELTTNMMITTMSYGLMTCGGVAAIISSPAASLQQDAAKFTTLVYVLFLATVVLYALISWTFFLTMGETPVTYLRYLAPPSYIRFGICAVASALVIFVFSRRARRFNAALWLQLQNKAFWMVVYWVLTSVCATIAVSV